MLVEITDVCVEGLKGLAIHSDTNTLEREVSLLPIIIGLYVKSRGHWNGKKGRFSRYQSKNITDIDDFVGKFNTVIENNILAIANEMKNFGESTMSHKDTIKSIITEDQLLINEKHFHKHEVENVVNIMIVTNNIYPLKIEHNDRRYVV
ncbi:MAG: hypothetical protein EZS28_016078 [Streblomastix strix]|uniref:NrS-1 polymerase-like helicase domain-containing protein n=1 Tax=Streblomastix strix TaxID=222440 RepID=A0A5J4W1R3_9EUKA|nr:MAG: hypothetical protein EZS28_016078 [Streblomastix strix]